MTETQHVKTIALPDVLQTTMEAYIFDTLIDQNPYTAPPSVAEATAFAFWKMICHSSKEGYAGAAVVRDLQDTLESANSGQPISPLLLKNLAREPTSSSVQPDQTLNTHQFPDFLD